MIIVWDVQAHVALLQDTVLFSVDQSGSQEAVQLLHVLRTARQMGAVDRLLCLRLVRGVEPEGSWVLPATSSDHLPVAAGISW